MKKIAIFGGAFNPIHQGHINLALTFDIRVKFDKMILIPTHISPHKDSSTLADGEHRLNMCRLAAEQCERFDVSDMELRRSGKSFTIDTVRELRKDYPDDKFYMIVGSDMFLSIESWYQSHELLKMVTACAAAREPGEYTALIKKQRQLDTLGVKSVVCEKEALPISSTIIRERVAKGMPVTDYLPTNVDTYIREHGLYRS